MIEYLQRQEAELRRAAYDQPRPRRMPRAVLPALTVAAMLAVAVLVISNYEPRERAATNTGAVDATVGDRMSFSVPPGPRILGISVDAREPVQVRVAVNLDGSTLASVTKEIETGRRGIAVPLPADVTGPAQVTVTVTDNAGNVRSFERSTDLRYQPAPIEDFDVLLTATNIVPEPDAFPASFLHKEFGDPAEYHEAFSDPEVGQVWAIRTDTGFCALHYGPADSVMSGCVEPSQAFAEGACCPIIDPNGFGAMALVPNGTTDARATYRDGTSEAIPVRSNVVLALGNLSSIEWVAPDGTTRRFAVPSSCATTEGNGPEDLQPLRTMRTGCDNSLAKTPDGDVPADLEPQPPMPNFVGMTRTEVLCELRNSAVDLTIDGHPENRTPRIDEGYCGGGLGVDPDPPVTRQSPGPGTPLENGLAEGTEIRLRTFCFKAACA